MRARIDLSSFNHALMGSVIDVASARVDPRLRKLEFAHADLDGDGRIRTRAETSALFRELDRLDRDESLRGLRWQARSDRRSSMAPAIEAIADLTGVDSLRRAAARDVVLAGPASGGMLEGREFVACSNEVVLVKDRRDTVARHGRVYNLRAPGDRGRYAVSLDLPDAQTRRVEEAIERAARAHAADEIAHIAWVWAAAEARRPIPARLVLPSPRVTTVGDAGYEGSMARREPLRMLARTMPRAAACVEELHFPGSAVSDEQTLPGDWRQVFANLKIVWRYSGPVHDIQPGTRDASLWSEAALGNRTAIEQLIAARSRTGERIAAWSVRHGHSHS